MRTCESLFNLSRSKDAIHFFNDAYYLNQFVEVLGCLSGEMATLQPVLSDEKLEEILDQAKFCVGREAWLQNPHCQSMCSSFPILNQNAFSQMMRSAHISETFSNLFLHLNEDLEFEPFYLKEFEKNTQSMVIEEENSVASPRDSENFASNTQYNRNSQLTQKQIDSGLFRIEDSSFQNLNESQNDFDKLKNSRSHSASFRLSKNLSSYNSTPREKLKNLIFDKGFEFFIDKKISSLSGIEKIHWDPNYGKGWNIESTPIKEFTNSLFIHKTFILIFLILSYL